MDRNLEKIRKASRADFLRRARKREAATDPKVEELHARHNYDKFSLEDKITLRLLSTLFKDVREAGDWKIFGSTAYHLHAEPGFIGQDIDIVCNAKHHDNVISKLNALKEAKVIFKDRNQTPGYSAEDIDKYGPSKRICFYVPRDDSEVIEVEIFFQDKDVGILKFNDKKSIRSVLIEDGDHKIFFSNKKELKMMYTLLILSELDLHNPETILEHKTKLLTRFSRMVGLGVSWPEGIMSALKETYLNFSDDVRLRPLFMKKLPAAISLLHETQKSINQARMKMEESQVKIEPNYQAMIKRYVEKHPEVIKIFEATCRAIAEIHYAVEHCRDKRSLRVLATRVMGIPEIQNRRELFKAFYNLNNREILILALNRVFRFYAKLYDIMRVKAQEFQVDNVHEEQLLWRKDPDVFIRHLLASTEEDSKVDGHEGAELFKLASTSDDDKVKVPKND